MKYRSEFAHTILACDSEFIITSVLEYSGSGTDPVLCQVSRISYEISDTNLTCFIHVTSLNVENLGLVCRF